MKKETISRESLWRQKWRQGRILFSVIIIGGIVCNNSTWAQSGPTTAATTPISTSGPSIDPTKNVLDTLQAAVTRLNDVIAAYMKRQDDLREGEAKFQNAMREAETKRLNDLRDADSRRVDQLAAQKQVFDLELTKVNKDKVDSSALLLATAVKELKTDSSERMAKLEQFANEQRGRSSAVDPANMKLLEEVRLLSQERSLASGNKTGQSDAIYYIIALITGLLTLAGLIVAGIVAVKRPQQHQPYPYPMNNGYPPNNGNGNGYGYSSQPPTKNV